MAASRLDSGAPTEGRHYSFTLTKGFGNAPTASEVSLRGTMFDYSQKRSVLLPLLFLFRLELNEAGVLSEVI